MASEKMVKQWLTYAVRDLRLAQKILTMGPDFKYGAGFHAQQSVEKAVKGFLVSKAVRPPRTQDIEELSKLLVEAEPKLARFVQSANKLTDYAVRFRCPDAEIKPATFLEVKSAVTKAKKIFDSIAALVDHKRESLRPASIGKVRSQI